MFQILRDIFSGNRKHRAIEVTPPIQKMPRGIIKRFGKYQVRVYADGMIRSIGTFEDLTEAIDALGKWKRLMFKAKHSKSKQDRVSAMQRAFSMIVARKVW